MSPLDEGLQTFLNGLLIFDSDTEGHERFIALVGVRTGLADNLMGVLPSEVELYCVLLGLSLNGCLKSVHKHVEEFLEELEIMKKIPRRPFTPVRW